MSPGENSIGLTLQSLSTPQIRSLAFFVPCDEQHLTRSEQIQHFQQDRLQRAFQPSVHSNFGGDLCNAQGFGTPPLLRLRQIADQKSKDDDVHGSYNEPVDIELWREEPSYPRQGKEFAIGCHGEH